MMRTDFNTKFQHINVFMFIGEHEQFSLSLSLSPLDAGKSIFMPEQQQNEINNKMKRTLWCWNLYLWFFLRLSFTESLHLNTTFDKLIQDICTLESSLWVFSVRQHFVTEWHVVRLPIIHVHWQIQLWCGPRTCCKRKKCIPKYSILFIYVCTPETINMWANENWRQKCTSTRCAHTYEHTVIPHVTIAHSMARTHWHQLVH